MNSAVAPVSLREITAEKGIFEKLALSYVPTHGDSEGFYRKLGFEPTGRVDEGEVVLALPLTATVA